MKIEFLRPFVGKSHIRHQVKLPVLNHLQAIAPFAWDKLELPAFLSGNVLQQFDEQARRLAVLAGMNLWRVFVEADFDRALLTFGTAAQGQQGYQDYDRMPQ